MALTKRQKAYQIAWRAAHRTYQAEWSSRHPGYFTAANKKWYIAHPEYGRMAKRVAYKATWNANNSAHRAMRYTARLEKRAGREKSKRCEVCRKSSFKMCFDHDHKTGLFRGWLCHHCNVALGYSKDASKLLRALAVYLERPATALFVGHAQPSAYTIKKLLGQRPTKCAVCKHAGKICMDHDHKTGFFRGWLCNACNSVCGHVFDSPKILIKLADYLDGRNEALKKKKAA